MLFNKPLDDTVIRAQPNLTIIFLQWYHMNGNYMIFYFVTRKLFQIENQ